MRSGPSSVDPAKAKESVRTPGYSATTVVVRTLVPTAQVLLSKNDTGKYVDEVVEKARVVIEGCGWHFIGDRSASDVQAFLGEFRRKGRSVQTSNHYLRAIKQFSHWLVTDRRASGDPLEHLQMLDVKTDRRHDRRTLSGEEIERLLDAARQGPPVESISGVDRAMLYVLSAWTGFRKKELGSLTIRSFQLEGLPYTVTVQAAYSKRRHRDVQVLHSDVAQLLREWLAGRKGLSDDALLFPVSGQVPGGTERKTAKMMRRDLDAARKRWIAEAETEEERRERERSDFLSYCNADGLFADFHAHRHTFISSLSRANVSPKLAQDLARHSDIRLTMNVYTHLDLHEQKAAIESLPGPPGQHGSRTGDAPSRAAGEGDAGRQEDRFASFATGGAHARIADGAHSGAQQITSNRSHPASNCTEERLVVDAEPAVVRAATACGSRALCINPHQTETPCTDRSGELAKVHSEGFEPPTLGSEDRCSIQLSYECNTLICNLLR